MITADPARDLRSAAAFPLREFRLRGGAFRWKAAPVRARCPGAGSVIVMRECWWTALCGSGGDRLSRVLRHSTMGAGVFNGRVRDGIGFWARRSGHQTGATQFFWDLAAQGAATSSVSFGKHVVAAVALRR